MQVEALATRLAWAVGYFVETTYYVAEGRIEGASDLQACRQLPRRPTGASTHARFELDEDRRHQALRRAQLGVERQSVRRHARAEWSQDRDDVAVELGREGRARRRARIEYGHLRAPRPPGGREARYLIIDWGGALGRWGNIVQRGRWDCDGFAAESARSSSGVDGDELRFGYTGQRTADIARRHPRQRRAVASRDREPLERAADRRRGRCERRHRRRDCGVFASAARPPRSAERGFELAGLKVARFYVPRCESCA